MYNIYHPKLYKLHLYRSSITLAVFYVTFLLFIFNSNAIRSCKYAPENDGMFYLRGQSPEGCIKSNGQLTIEDTINILRPIVISGPSGVGKGTLIELLMKRFEVDTFGFSVSHTTRQPRPGEIDGVHYHFVTMDEMKDAIQKEKFIEYSQVHGNVYGTGYDSVLSVQRAGKICILDIDVKGAETVKASNLNPYLIFIAPPSMDKLEERLRGRKTESEEAIQRRLGNAKAEIDRGLSIKQNFDMVVVNEDLNTAVDELVNIILEEYPFVKTNN